MPLLSYRFGDMGAGLAQGYTPVIGGKDFRMPAAFKNCQ
jgi:hypothetical protein